MKKTLLFAALLAAALSAYAQTPEDSLAFVGYDWQWTSLRKGAASTSGTLDLFGFKQTISIVKYPARRFRTSIVHAPGKNCGTTDTLAMKAGGYIACNGSYFNMKKLTPTTLFCIDGDMISGNARSELHRSDGILAIRRCGHRVDLMAADSTQFERLAGRYRFVMGSGPLLISGGKSIDNPHEGGFFHKMHPRTIVGKDAEGYLYFIVIDGRFPLGKGATIAQTTAVCRYLGLTDALNLDGGGSSTLWDAEEGVINHPYDNHTWDHAGCRKVPNIVVAK